MPLSRPTTATKVPDKGLSSQINLEVGRWGSKCLCLRGESIFEFRRMTGNPNTVIDGGLQSWEKHHCLQI